VKRVQKFTPSKTACEQSRMLIEAKTAILNSRDFLPATEVARHAGFSSTNLSVQPSKWKRNREIFAIQHGREDYLPLYGLDPGDHRPRKAMAEILKIFGGAKDGWGLAFWFAGLNSSLDDERPQDVLATDPERVIASAKDEMAELQHSQTIDGSEIRTKKLPCVARRWSRTQSAQVETSNLICLVQFESWDMDRCSWVECSPQQHGWQNFMLSMQSTDLGNRSDFAE
jgi:hypothetical protein